jgi:hypothetical protein
LTAKIELPGHSKLLSLILLVSAFLRICLVLQGGAYLWPDETRYLVSHSIVNHVSWHDYERASELLKRPEHILFKVIGMVPAVLEQSVSSDGSLREINTSRKGAYRTYSVDGVVPKALSQSPGTKIPALFFSLFSVWNIWIIWRISLALGAGKDEALLAALLLALSSSNFYWSRHLVPYDLSMTFGLLALLVAIKKIPRNIDSFVCGLLSSACFLTYNGYWTLGAVAMILHTFWLRSGVSGFISRAWRSGLGLALPIITILALGYLVGEDSATGLNQFSKTINMGTYSEGGTLPIEYLWKTEYFLSLFWFLALAVSLWDVFRRHQNGRLTVGVTGVLLIYGSLLIGSVWLEKFVVYGRLARPLVPFLCLLAAYQLLRLRNENEYGKRALPILITLAMLQAAVNFYTPLTQVFPYRFEQQVKQATERSGYKNTREHFAHPMYPGPEKVPSYPDHQIALRAPHPLEYLPYQYEAFSPEQRSALQSADISMRLYVPADQLRKNE